MKYILVFILFALSSCAASTDAAMKTWVGHPEPELLSVWGAPDKTTTSGTKTIHTWAGRNTYGQIICSKTFVVANTRIESYSTDCFF